MYIGIPLFATYKMFASFICTTNGSSLFSFILFQSIMPGPPFVFGSLLVLISILVAYFLPNIQEPAPAPPQSPSIQLVPIKTPDDLRIPLLSDVDGIGIEPANVDLKNP